MSCDGCRQNYAMPVQYKTPKEAAQRAHEAMKASLILLDIVDKEGNIADGHLLEQLTTAGTKQPFGSIILRTRPKRRTFIT